MADFPVAEEAARSCRHCATIGRFKYRGMLDRGFLPSPDEPTATVTFLRIADRTYALTAAHVIRMFDRMSQAEGVEFEGYFCPAKPGIAILGPFITPPADWSGRELDVALCPIDAALPAHLGKEAFRIEQSGDASWPISHALAVGFPTASKDDMPDKRGVRLSMKCVHALAEGMGGAAESDQVQFYSEIAEKPSESSLSGMSGGPVFWSDDTAYGLVGFVKEALDVVPKEGEETLYDGPRVHFLCQRADFRLISEWASYADSNWQKARDKINAAISGRG